MENPEAIVATNEKNINDTLLYIRAKRNEAYGMGNTDTEPGDFEVIEQNFRAGIWSPEETRAQVDALMANKLEI